jgi:NAD(P)H-hydrate repair Nnr-like enzyme with NAD(P)H-hydrate epimerase domain
LRIGLQAGQQIATNGGDGVVTAETLIQCGFGHVVVSFVINAASGKTSGK